MEIRTEKPPMLFCILNPPKQTAFHLPRRRLLAPCWWLTWAPATPTTTVIETESNGLYLIAISSTHYILPLPSIHIPAHKISSSQTSSSTQSLLLLYSGRRVRCSPGNQHSDRFPVSLRFWNRVLEILFISGTLCGFPRQLILIAAIAVNSLELKWK